MSRRTENGESYLLGMNTGDLETALKPFSEDATYYGIAKDSDGKISRKLHANKNEIRAYIGEWLRTATHGITYKIDKSEEIGDVVLVYWSDEATGDDETYTNHGVMVYEFNDDDSIKHARAYQPLGPLEKFSFLEQKS
jgi:SnoaL-like domain